MAGYPGSFAECRQIGKDNVLKKSLNGNNKKVPDSLLPGTSVITAERSPPGGILLRNGHSYN